MSQNMIVCAFNNGDSSVGIQGDCFVLDTGYTIESFRSCIDREEFRTEFKKFADRWAGDSCVVQFSDECVECGAIREDIEKIVCEKCFERERCTNEDYP